ncbi:fimbrial protein [Phocaeicola barnesiae]|uniref:Major fimbrial subunit protein N-terminal domain-containing protein n=1 Tax=Phocaeicola barnesiae TaxID=376804 RepID=A0AAW5N747_9BACT|nr:fimbrial protein [Phocaeicola barnesiae]MCR8874768.1 hypothetical protein [Phocaeicola barnesiae]
MINKHSIYNWLFFPLLASLLAGSVASCINDPAMEEDTSGKSTLSITVRGVTNNPDQDGYDEYIETLRIIVFDASGLVCNKFYNQESIKDWTVKSTSSDTYDIIQELQDFSGGNCRFYFIANEEEYNIYNENTTSTSLSRYLGSDQLTEEQLKACIIASTPDNEDWNNKPILMIANPSAQYIKPGDNIEITDVELVRCIAKVQLIVQKDNTVENKIPENDVVTISDVSLHGTRPESYSLWDTKSYFVINNSEYQHDFTITDDNKTVGYGTDGSPAYTSDMVYFPEKLYQDNTAEGDLYFTFTLTYTPKGGTAIERTYTVAIGEDADKDGTVVDYNIYRNTVYTVTATLQWQPTEPTMNIQVDAWDGEVKVDVPDFE